MKLVFIILLISVYSKAADDLNQNTDESLDVAKNFRRALIEALQRLEKEEATKQNGTNQEDLLESDLDGSNFGHKIRDKPTKHESTVTSIGDSGKTNIFVHSFAVNAQNSFANKKSTDKITKLGVTAKRIPKDNAISASATSPITGRSISNNLFSSTTLKSISVTPKSSLSSPNPTVSTPEDETKAKVEDVQFIHAPLVAAFTVEQDDKGLPQKVIPLFGNKQEASQNNLSLQNSVISQTQNSFTLQNQARQYQTTLENRHRTLEEQIRVLQEQRRQQELLLQQQQQALHLHTLQQQNLRLEDLQRQKLRLGELNRQNSQSISNLSPKPTTDNSETIVQPSISFQPNRFSQSLTQNSNQQFNQDNFKQFNQGSQNKNQQFSQALTQVPYQQFNQRLIQNSNSFNQGVTQTNQFNQGITQTNQFNQPLTQTSNQQFNQELTQNQFNQAVSQNNNQFNLGVSQNSNPQFGQTSNQQFGQQFSEQTLPTKSAINFQKAIDLPYNQGFNHINQQQVPNQYRDKIFNNDNYLQDFFYRQRTLTPPPPRSNRVFRQESQVGNFGVNTFNNPQNQFADQYNQFTKDHSFAQNQQFFGAQRNNVNSNGFVPSNFFSNLPQQTSVDNRLKNLIYQSGLGQGEQEDLNIVSKVLSLDHTGKYQNFLFGE